MTGKRADFQQGLHSGKGSLGDVKRQLPHWASHGRMKLTSEVCREREQDMQSSGERERRSFPDTSLP